MASLVGGLIVIVAVFGYAAREFRRKPELPES
jgi:hypothetical protein